MKESDWMKECRQNVHIRECEQSVLSMLRLEKGSPNES